MCVCVCFCLVFQYFILFVNSVLNTVVTAVRIFSLSMSLYFKLTQYFNSITVVVFVVCVCVFLFVFQYLILFVNSVLNTVVTAADIFT